MNLKEKIFKKNDKELWCDFYYLNTRIRIKTQKGEDYLVKKIKQRIKEIELLTKYPNLKLDKNLEEYFYEFLNSKDVKDSTKRKYPGIIRMYFQEFKDLKLVDFKNSFVTEWYEKIFDLTRTKKMTYKRGNEMLGFMRGFISYLKHKNYLINDIDTEILQKYNGKDPKSIKTENNYITHKELLILNEQISLIDNAVYQKMSKFNKEQDYLIFLINFLYYTGMRINEAIAIQRKDIIADERNHKTNYYVLVYKQIEDNRYKIKYFLKNNDIERKVYIKKENYLFFSNILDKYDYKNDDYIFDFYQSGTPSTRKNFVHLLNKTLRHLREENKLPATFPRVLTPHGFRYSNTLYLQEIGLSVQNAAKMQGHTVSVMLNIYSRFNKEEINNIFG